MDNAPPLRVGLAGISAVAGGSDGWADERAAVYAFTVDCRNASVHSFSERFSSALEKHERMRGAGLLPESIAFPSKRRLRNMTDDVRAPPPHPPLPKHARYPAPPRLQLTSRAPPFP